MKVHSSRGPQLVTLTHPNELLSPTTSNGELNICSRCEYNHHLNARADAQIAIFLGDFRLFETVDLLISDFGLF